jgi:hypothetical protein
MTAIWPEELMNGMVNDEVFCGAQHLPSSDELWPCDALMGDIGRSMDAAELVGLAGTKCESAVAVRPCREVGRRFRPALLQPVLGALLIGLVEASLAACWCISTRLSDE